jgi:hypothetical protein
MLATAGPGESNNYGGNGRGSSEASKERGYRINPQLFGALAEKGIQ